MLGSTQDVCLGGPYLPPIPLLLIHWMTTKDGLLASLLLLSWLCCWNELMLSKLSTTVVACSFLIFLASHTRSLFAAATIWHLTRTRAVMGKMQFSLVYRSSLSWLHRVNHAIQDSKSPNTFTRTNLVLILMLNLNTFPITNIHESEMIYGTRGNLRLFQFH